VCNFRPAYKSPVVAVLPLFSSSILSVCFSLPVVIPSFVYKINEVAIFLKGVFPAS